MSKDKRDIIQLEKRATISEKDLEQAFQKCDDAFWAKAVELFPEIESGDTDPMATMAYSETVKAFMKHWLGINARIMVDGLTEPAAVELARAVGDAHGDSYAVTDDNYLLTTQVSGELVALRIVELEHEGASQGFAVQVLDETGNTSTIARTQSDLEYDVETTIRAIRDRNGE